jgi:IS5 family transposase
MASLFAMLDGFLMRHLPSPSDEQNYRSDDLFRARLDQIIRHNHPLIRLADAMPWNSIVEKGSDLLPPM